MTLRGRLSLTQQRKEAFFNDVDDDSVVGGEEELEENFEESEDQDSGRAEASSDNVGCADVVIADTPVTATPTSEQVEPPDQANRNPVTPPLPGNRQSPASFPNIGIPVLELPVASISRAAACRGPKAHEGASGPRHAEGEEGFGSQLRGHGQPSVPGESPEREAKFNHAALPTPGCGAGVSSKQRDACHLEVDGPEHRCSPSQSSLSAHAGQAMLGVEPTQVLTASQLAEGLEVAVAVVPPFSESSAHIRGGEPVPATEVVALSADMDAEFGFRQSGVDVAGVVGEPTPAEVPPSPHESRGCTPPAVPPHELLALATVIPDSGGMNAGSHTSPLSTGGLQLPWGGAKGDPGRQHANLADQEDPRAQQSQPLDGAGADIFMTQAPDDIDLKALLSDVRDLAKEVCPASGHGEVLLVGAAPRHMLPEHGTAQSDAAVGPAVGPENVAGAPRESPAEAGIVPAPALILLEVPPAGAAVDPAASSRAARAGGATGPSLGRSRRRRRSADALFLPQGSEGSAPKRGAQQKRSALQLMSPHRIPEHGSNEERGGPREEEKDVERSPPLGRGTRHGGSQCAVPTSRATRKAHPPSGVPVEDAATPRHSARDSATGSRRRSRRARWRPRRLQETPPRAAAAALAAQVTPPRGPRPSPAGPETQLAASALDELRASLPDREPMSGGLCASELSPPALRPVQSMVDPVCWQGGHGRREQRSGPAAVTEAEGSVAASSPVVLARPPFGEGVAGIPQPVAAVPQNAGVGSDARVHRRDRQQKAAPTLRVAAPGAEATLSLCGARQAATEPEDGNVSQQERVRDAPLKRSRAGKQPRVPRAACAEAMAPRGRKQVGAGSSSATPRARPPQLTKQGGDSLGTPAVSPTRDREATIALVSSAAEVSDTLERRARRCALTLVRHTRDGLVPAFTHFVSSRDLRLTVHALIALAGGRPIVTPSWVEASVQAGVALEASKFLVCDEKAERLHGFSLESSWKAARQRRLLEDCTVFVSPSLVHAEMDGGKGIAVVLQAALGQRGELASSMTDLATADSRRKLVLVEDGATRRQLRDVPTGCEVWRRHQFRQAVIQQTFSHQKAFLLT